VEIWKRDELRTLLSYKGCAYEEGGDKELGEGGAQAKEGARKGRIIEGFGKKKKKKGKKEKKNN